MRAKVRVAAMATGALLVASLSIVAVPQAGASSVPGFNGKTIRVAGMWDSADFPGAQVGAQAYFTALNQTSYLKGVKIQFVTYANDDSDPATALTDVRQLTTQDNVFAIVPDLSDVNPSYLNAQHILYVGAGYDGTYCSSRATTNLWGYSYEGCQVPSDPPRYLSTFFQMYDYVKAKTSTAHPTMALISSDNASGTSAVKLGTVAAKGIGFKVVYNKAGVSTTASDYTPYVEQLMTANGGKQPQAIACFATSQCIPMWMAVKNAGYTGTFFTPLGPISALDSTLQGTVTVAFYNTQPNPGLSAMEKALNAVSPGTQPTGYSNVPAYFSAAMFAAGVHNVQAKKEAITPANVQKALSTMTWEIPGLVGPIKYPVSTVVGTPYCTEFIAYTAGTTKVVDPYTCSYTQYKVTPQAQSSS